MDVEFVLGNVVSKRDEYLEGKIAHLIEENIFEDVLVIVPPHLTFFYESNLLKKLNLQGTMGISVQSPNRIADEILQKTYGKASKSIDSIGKNLIIRSILNTHINELKSLYTCAHKPNMACQIADLIKEFKMLDITPQMLMQQTYPNENTEKKIKDIAYIYMEYLNKTMDLLDNEDKFNLAINNIKKADFIKKAHVFVTGFENFDSQRTRFLKEIMDNAKTTCISFLYDEPKSKNSYIYNICNISRERLIAHGQKHNFFSTIILEERSISNDIKITANNLFAYPHEKFNEVKDISITYAANQEEEVRCLAAQIAYLHEKCSYRFSEIAIVFGSDENYKKLINKLFPRANIPVFSGEKRTLAENPFSRYVLYLLELCQGKLKKESLIAYGKTGFAHVENIEKLQNYAYAHYKDGFSFLKNIEDTEVEECRNTLMTPVEELRKMAQKVYMADELIDIVLTFIKKANCLNILEEQIKQMYDLGYIKSAEYSSQVYEKVISILNQAKSIFYKEKIAKSKLHKIIKDTFETVEINVIPPLTDEVQVFEISQMGIKDFKSVFVIGVNEEKIPDYSVSDDVLADWQRAFILEHAAGIKHVTKIEKQRLSLLKTVSAPVNKLFFSCVKNNVSAVSPIIFKLLDIFDKIKINNAREVSLMLKENAYIISGENIKKLQKNINIDTKEKNIADLLIKNGGLRMEFVMESINNKNMPSNLKKDLCAGLYKEINGSASRFESYYQCPYKHFMAYGIKPKIYNEYVLNQLDMGNYAHEVLDICLKTVKETGNDIADDKYQEIVDLSKEKAKTLNERYFSCEQNKNIIIAMDREIDICLKVIRKQMALGNMHHCETEYTFAQHFKDGITVSGKIDRVDFANLNGKEYISIVDYKTGNTKFLLHRLFFGISVQLAIYIMAAKELFENSILAGANYFYIHIPFFEDNQDFAKEYAMSGITELDEMQASDLFGVEENKVYSLNLKISKDGSFDSRSKEKVFSQEDMDTLLDYTKKLVENAFDHIKEGDINIIPSIEADNISCKYCDYISICMFNQDVNEVRIIEKQDKDTLIKEMREL